MTKLAIAVPVLALAIGGTSACATKKMVRTEVGEVNGKVETLSRTVEETQERTRANEGKIGEVDQKAQAAGQRADAASRTATEAGAAARAVNVRADAIERAAKRLVYEVTLSEDKGNFKFGKAAMPDEAPRGPQSARAAAQGRAPTARSSRSKDTPTTRVRRL